jgi:hypothetical protein
VSDFSGGIVQCRRKDAIEVISMSMEMAKTQTVAVGSETSEG